MKRAHAYLQASQAGDPGFKSRPPHQNLLTPTQFTLHIGRD